MLGCVTQALSSTASSTTGPGPLPTHLAEATSSDTSLRRFLHGLPGVDQVGAEARAASLGTRSIKTTAKQFALDLAIRMVDLTTLEGQDTPGKVRALCSKAMRPDPSDPSCPQVAAVCVYNDLVPVAVEALARHRDRQAVERLTGAMGPVCDLLVHLLHGRAHCFRSVAYCSPLPSSTHTRLLFPRGAVAVGAGGLPSANGWRQL